VVGDEIFFLYGVFLFESDGGIKMEKRQEVDDQFWEGL